MSIHLRLRRKKVILQTQIGRCKVKLRRNKETGVICLKQGWPEFVKRHDVTLGEFVFFQDTGDLHLNVSAYNTNFCEKEFLDKEEDGSKYAIVSIPIDFMRSPNMGETQTSVVLIDPKGREWAVKLMAENMLQNEKWMEINVNRHLLTFTS